MERVERLLDGIDLSCRCAEIGALAEPVLPRESGIFVDVADTATLRAKFAKDPHVPTEAIVDVSAVLDGRTLLESLGEPVDYMVASHVIEHVPNLVGWLAELRDAVRREVRLAIPDKRFTFDCLRQDSRLSDVLNAYVVGAARPLPHAVLDFHLNAVEIDCEKAWRGDYANLRRYNTCEQAIEAAQDAASGAYRDVHCWVFTPESFGTLMADLACCGLLRLACADFHTTAKDRFEFFVAMRPCDDAGEVEASWRAMVAQAQADLPSRLAHQIAQLGALLKPVG